MKIKTRDFGEIDIAENEILSFPRGIYAFEEDRRFVLISPCGENKYPMWLQSLDNENLCFIVFDPKEFSADYKVTMDDEAKNAIGMTESSVIDYLVIAVIADDYIDSTVNLKSPIAVNSDNNTAVQVIAPESYPLKFPVFKKEEN